MEEKNKEADEDLKKLKKDVRFGNELTERELLGLAAIMQEPPNQEE